MSALAMGPYRAIISARFRTLLQYRAAALAGIGTQLFFGYVRIAVYDGFYRSSTAPQPMTYDQVVSYVWLGQALLLLVMFGVEGDIAAMIRSGAVAYEMTRPIDLYNVWFCRCFSARAAPLLMRCMPILVIAGLFLGLQAPASAGAAVLFVASILLALLLASAMVTLITLSLLWTISGEGVHRLAPAMIFFFSGIVIPLPLFPAWCQPILNALPFRGLIDVPFRIYLGHIGAHDAAVAMAQQVMWIAALVLLGRWLLSRGLKRLVVQGG